MKKTFFTILLAGMAMAVPSGACAENPDDLDLPEEKWEMHYDLYESLLYDNPEYRDLTREVTIKGTYGTIYIQGIVPDYPDVWIKARRNTYLHIVSGQVVAQNDGKTVYFQIGGAVFGSSSATDREYTLGVYLKPASENLWLKGDDGNDENLLIPQTHWSGQDRIDGTFWFTETPGVQVSFTRTYHFDGSVTGDDFGPKPIYLHPSFKKIDSSGIQDNVLDEQRPEDNRVFDLNGRQVNPDRLTPGIYIRAGRKFIVR